MLLLNLAMQFWGGKADVWLAVLCWEEITLQSILIVQFSRAQPKQLTQYVSAELRSRSADTFL